MERIEQANKEALRRILSGEPELIDVCPAGEVIPELDNHSIGHAGPPIAWEEMCGPMQGAIMGAAVYEGMASTLEEAAEMAASGKIHFISQSQYALCWPHGRYDHPFHAAVGGS